MRRYIIELRGPILRRDLSVSLFRLGKRIKILAHSQVLPEPYVGIDPKTGEPMAKIYLRLSEEREQDLTTVCDNFEYAHQHKVRCTIHIIKDSLPAPF